MRSLSLRFSLAALTLAAAASLVGVAGPADARPRERGGVVYLHRPAAFAGAFTQPAVLVDGEQVATIGSGECVAMRLPAGRHEIVVRDQTSILSRLGLELHAARIKVWDGASVFVEVRPLQDAAQFNDKSPGYSLLVADRGPRC